MGLYRKLLRATATAFQGDTQMLDSSRREIRDHFLKNRSVDDDAKLKELFAMGEESAVYLRENIVQAELQDDTGRYQMKVRNEHTSPEPGQTATGHRIGQEAKERRRRRRRKKKE